MLNPLRVLFGLSTLALELVSCVPVNGATTKRDSAQSFTAQLKGVSYVNKGLVGFGLIPSNFRESTGDTFGGVGSAIALKQGTWSSKQDGTYVGTLVVQPDRGYNIETTIDYQSRQHDIDFVLNPYYGTSGLDFSAAQKTLQLKYTKTTLRYERQNAKTTGLDATVVRQADKSYGDPELPVSGADSGSRLSIDAEGLVANVDGTFWMSDEYGPYVYLYGKDGQLLKVIQPPKAFLPYVKGKLNFTSVSNPDTGRTPNQGFEGLTLDPATNTLYALLQSATIQDGGNNKNTSSNTRLLAWDVSKDDRTPLVGEWVVPLPRSSKGVTFAASELHFVSPGVFLVLARDGNGRGGSDPTSEYKQIDLISTVGATDIHGTEYDDPSHPIAKNGTLLPNITPATYVPFLNLIDGTQLKRFGLHNGSPDDATLLDGKWESIAIASADDPQNPDDYFLFTAADNDFISTQGYFDGKPFNGGSDVDNQFLVFRVTLPGSKGN